MNRREFALASSALILAGASPRTESTALSNPYMRDWAEFLPRLVPGFRRTRDLYSIARRIFLVEDIPADRAKITDPMWFFRFHSQFFPLFPVSGPEGEKFRKGIQGSVRVWIRTEGYRAVKVACESVPTNYRIKVPVLTLDAISDAYSILDEEGYSVKRLFLNPGDVGLVKKDGPGIVVEGKFPKLRDLGFIGKLWGADLIETSEIPKGTVLICSDRESCGRLLVGRDIGFYLNNHGDEKTEDVVPLTNPLDESLVIAGGAGYYLACVEEIFLRSPEKAMATVEVG